MNLQTIKTLQSAIDKQLIILKEILTIEKEKHSVLLSGKLRDFSSINQNLLDKLETLEISELNRNQIMESFISEHTELFKDSKTVTFNQILETIKHTSYHKDMLALYEESRITVDTIKHYTNVNKDLIETALNVLNITLQQENKEIDYTKRTEVHGNSSILLNRII